MNILFSALVCFLALYGLIQMYLNLISPGKNDKLLSSQKVYMVVTVKNQEDSIEGILRAIVWKSLNQLGGKEVPDIMVIDLGSEDQTPVILEKLAKEYDFIHPTNKDGYIKMIAG